MIDFKGVKIEWLGHASFRLTSGKVVYIDPFHLKTEEKADFILITHGHYDHCSIPDIRKIIKPDTIIIATPDCASKLTKLEHDNLKLIAPGDKIDLGEIIVETVPAYNLEKEFHPKMNDWVGYIITMSGARLYHTGDTDIIPEMKPIKTDVMMLPVGGTYTMDADEAARAASIIKPQLAIPMHYGDIVGKQSDAARFKEIADVKVEILKPSN